MKKLALVVVTSALFVLAACLYLMVTVYRAVEKVAIATFGPPSTKGSIMDRLFEEVADELKLRRFLNALKWEFKRRGIRVNLTRKVKPDYFFYEFYMLLMLDIITRPFRELPCRLGRHSPGEVDDDGPSVNSYSCNRCGKVQKITPHAQMRVPHGPWHHPNAG